MMRSRFDQQLEELNRNLIEMGEQLVTSIQSACSAMINQSAEEARAAIAFDAEVDQKENEIEAMCLKLLLRQQPVARDLRHISAILKMITDMERIGDQAADISEIVLQLVGTPYIKKLEHLPMMADKTIEMVTKGIDAFVRKDLDLALSVIEMDDEVDALFVIIKNELIELIGVNPDNGWQALDLLMIAKYYERIGDHAQNIAEWAEYAITGVHRYVYD
ncbi:MAG: phosphate signaling complex protein PhoU [Christensenellales bacterium]|jgi:phosphate transport system protein